MSLGACGDTVTNPQLEGFDANPLVIAGDWSTVVFDSQGNATCFDAELVPSAGFFLGRFEMLRIGQILTLQFTDGVWDGTFLRFTAETTLGEVTPSIEWEALYLPARDDGPDPRPDRLRLSSDVIGGPGAPVEYWRPEDLPQC